MVIYLKRNFYNVLCDTSFKTGRISVTRGSRLVLIKVVLFQLKGLKSSNCFSSLVSVLSQSHTTVSSLADLALIGPFGSTA